MFDTAEDEMSSSSSASGADGTSNTERQSKEMRFFPSKEDPYPKSSLNTNGSFPDIDRSFSSPREGIILPHKHYHCRMCDQEFENKSDMQHHAKNVHRMDEKSHKCQKCLKSFPSSQQLAQHLLVHTNVRKYSCKFCDKMFKQLSHVQQHLRIHTGERPYKCTVETCLKSFRQLSSLQQHIKGHNIPLPKSYPITKLPSHHYSNQIIARPHDLICQVCERQCENDSMFFEHLQQQHPDYWKVLSGEHKINRCKEDVIEVFVCPTCSQEFAQIGELKRHQSVHHPDDEINDSSFNICVCQKIFNNDSQFIKHLQSKGDFQHLERYKEMLKKIHSSNVREYGVTNNENGIVGHGVGNGMGNGAGSNGVDGGGDNDRTVNGVYSKHLEQGKRKFEDGYINGVKIEDTQESKLFKRNGSKLGEEFNKDRIDMGEEYKRDRNEIAEGNKRDVDDLRDEFEKGSNSIDESYKKNGNTDTEFKRSDNGLSEHYRRFDLGEDCDRDRNIISRDVNDMKSELKRDGIDYGDSYKQHLDSGIRDAFKRDGVGMRDNYIRNVNTEFNFKRDEITEVNNVKRDGMSDDLKGSPYGSSESCLSSENPADKSNIFHSN